VIVVPSMIKGTLAGIYLYDAWCSIDGYPVVITKA
jgi:hypothetical protein